VSDKTNKSDVYYVILQCGHYVLLIGDSNDTHIGDATICVQNGHAAGWVQVSDVAIVVK